jgi:cellobiose-specific phosphotransferase system component IIA
MRTQRDMNTKVELKSTLQRTLREHDEAAVEAMRRAQSHLERAHEIQQRLAQLGGKRTNGAHA